MSILTIAIPTYNRQEELNDCLKSFDCFSREIKDKVSFFVSDNNSNYNIDSTIEKYRKSLKIELCKNITNIGMTQNFLNCYQRAEGKYVWLFSDDDCVTNNSLYQILDCIENKNPDYIFLNNSREKKNNGIKDITSYKTNTESLIRIAGISATLITSNIFRKDCLKRFLEDEFTTLFPHYELFFKVVARYDITYVIDGDLFTTTPNNSGGYKWFEVFVNDLNDLLDRNSIVISTKNRRFIENQLILKRYFKEFLGFGIESDSNKKFLSEKHDDVYFSLKNRLKHRILFWILINPVHITPLSFRKKLHSFINNKLMPIYRKRY